MCAHLYILYRSIPTWNARASKTLVAFVEGKGLQAVLFTSNCLAFCFFAYCYTSTLSYVNLGKVYMNFLLLDLQWVRRFICFCFSLLGVSKNLHTLCGLVKSLFDCSHPINEEWESPILGVQLASYWIVPPRFKFMHLYSTSSLLNWLVFAPSCFMKDSFVIIKFNDNVVTLSWEMHKWLLLGNI